MSTQQSDTYRITIGDEVHQELLDQEIEMRCGPSPSSALSTDHESTIHHHCDNTTESLLDHEYDTPGDELPIDSTVAGNRSRSTSHDNSPAGFSLHGEKPTILPGWPSSPKPIHTPIYVKALNGVFDVLLLACSAAFLAFAIVVNLHDRVPTAEHPRLTTALLRATKYVLSLETSLEGQS